MRSSLTRPPFEKERARTPIVYAIAAGRTRAVWKGVPGAGAFRTLRLARDFVEIGFGFWLVGGSPWKSGEVRQWNAV